MTLIIYSLGGALIIIATAVFVSLIIEKRDIAKMYKNIDKKTLDEYYHDQELKQLRRKYEV